MRRTFARLLAYASMVGAIAVLIPAGPSAQQTQGPTPEAMQRAQEAYQADQTRTAIARNKEGVVQGLMDRWRSEIGETQKGLDGFAAAFTRADAEKLVQLTQAKSWDGVVATLLGMNPEATLGSTSSDLVFTPVTPCRVMDSRFGAGAWLGPFTSGQTVSLYVSDPLNGNGHTQGGQTSCGIPFAAGNAVAINITVVPISGNGDLKIFPFGAVAPNSSIINFVSGLNLANATSAGIALANATNDLSIGVEFAGSVHIIVDVLGYYSAPFATALQTLRVDAPPVTLANNVEGLLGSPNCPAGYRLTGGGYRGSPSLDGLWVTQNGPGDTPPTFWSFRGHNTSGGSIAVTVYGVCARVPGR